MVTYERRRVADERRRRVADEWIKEYHKTKEGVRS